MYDEHGFIHFNHASASLPAPPTYGAMHDYLRQEEALGSHRATEWAQAALDNAAHAVSRLVGASDGQLAFVDSASRGWALALSAVPRQAGLDVFVSTGEWAANLMNIHRAPDVRWLSLGEAAHADWSTLLAQAAESANAGRVPVVSLPLVDCLGRAVPAWGDLATGIRELGGWLFVDASQAVGQMPVNMTDLGADALVFPARKWLRGPHGIGALVLSSRAIKQWQAPFIMDIHGTRWSPEHEELIHQPGASRFGAHGCAPLLKLGMGRAAQELLASGPTAVFKQIQSRAAQLRHALAALAPPIELLPGGSGIVSLRAPGFDHAELVRQLHARGLNAALITSRYAPLTLAPSDSLVRLSVHAITACEDVERGVALLGDVLAHPHR